MFGAEFAPQRRVLDGVRAFMRERRTPPGFPPVLLRQPSINLYCRVAIPMVLGDSVNAVWELGQLIHVVGMFFEQLQKRFGWNRVQFLTVALHAEANDDLFTQFVELLASEINRARLAPGPGILFHVSLLAFSVTPYETRDKLPRSVRAKGHAAPATPPRGAVPHKTAERQVELLIQPPAAPRNRAPAVRGDRVQCR